MEPMDGDQGLEKLRSTKPEHADEQSTDIDEENPWTFSLMAEPLEDRESNPKLIVTFKTTVEVHGFKLQGNTDDVSVIQFILSVQDESGETFVDVKKSNEEILVRNKYYIMFL